MIPVALYLLRASIHLELDNTELAEADFAIIEARNKPDNDSFEFVVLHVMHQWRDKMYEGLGCHDKAELDRQKAKDMDDIITAGSNADQS